MEANDDGIVQNARQVSSSNCDERPLVAGNISLLVIHSISLPPGHYGGNEVEQLFTNTLDCSRHPYFSRLAGLRVSAHFFIRRDGSLVQFVPTHLRAWHAGESAWKGRTKCNDFSLGVELEGTEDQEFAAVQYPVLADLTAILRLRYPIEDIVGHADIAPGRKTDPGSSFDWALYRHLING